MKFVTLHYSVLTCLWKWADNFRCNLSTKRSGLTAIMACPTIVLSSSVVSSRPNCLYFGRNIPGLLKSLIISTKRTICMSWPFGVTMVKFFSCLSFTTVIVIQENKFIVFPNSVPVTCVTHYVLFYLQHRTILFVT